VSKKPQFKTPLECAEHRDANRHKEGYNNFQDRCRINASKGKKQLPCGKCGRFLWPEDRCNLFA
jgi:RNase P subunit RPR2